MKRHFLVRLSVWRSCQLFGAVQAAALVLSGSMARAQDNTPPQAPAAVQPTGAPSPGTPQATDSGCLEETGDGCTLRWELFATSATGSSSQTSNSTQPNILFNLNWQLVSPKVSSADATQQAIASSQRSQAAAERVRQMIAARSGRASAPSTKGSITTLRWTFTTGFTQVPSAAKLQVVSTSTPANAATSSTTGTSSTTSNTSGACSPSTSGSSSAPSTCTAATQQEAFIAKSGFNFGWTLGQHGKGDTKSVLQGSAFSEIGFAGRGAVEIPVQSNQVVQSNGNTYVNLTSLNQSLNVFEFAEGVARFRIATHDAPAGKKSNTSAPITYANAADFFVAEAGYQYNTGLGQLAANPSTNTRPRFVGRFYVTPEISSTNHTKLLIGMEYSSGVNGGGKVVQLFFGTNLNLAKLFNPTSTNQ